jgi:hypothetical protein
VEEFANECLDARSIPGVSSAAEENFGDVSLAENPGIAYQEPFERPR